MNYSWVCVSKKQIHYIHIALRLPKTDALHSHFDLFFVVSLTCYFCAALRKMGPKLLDNCSSNTSLKGQDSSVGRAFDRKAQHDTDAIWVPGAARDNLSSWCSKGFFSQSTSSADSYCVRSAWASNDICAHLKNPKHWQPYCCLNTRKHCTHW